MTGPPSPCLFRIECRLRTNISLLLAANINTISVGYGYGSFHAKGANTFQKLHQVFCISMKFGTFVDLTEKLRMQKKIFKCPIICGAMITLKKRYFYSLRFNQ